MKVEFELFEEHEGRFIIAEPIGWKSAIAGLDRDPEFYSLIESFQTPLRLWGKDGALEGGRDWVLMVKKKWGVNARITGKIWYNPHYLIDPASTTTEVITITPITLPDLIDWVTRSVGGDIDWTESANPSVVLPGAWLNPKQSEIIWADYAFVSGREYTININITKVINTPPGAGFRSIHLCSVLVMDSVFSTIFQNVDDTSGATPQTVTLTFLATAQCTKVGVKCIDDNDVTITINTKSGTQKVVTIQNTAGGRLLFEGELPIIAMVEALSELEGGVLDYTMQVAFTPIGIWADFLKRFSTAVDITSAIDLNGGDVIPTVSRLLKLPSQVLKRKSTFEGPLFGEVISDEDFTIDLGIGGHLVDETLTTYGQGAEDLNQNEILDSVSGLLFNIDSATPSDVVPCLEIGSNESGDLTVLLKPGAKLSGGLKTRIIADDLDPTQNKITAIELNVSLWVKKNSDTPLLLGAGAASLGGLTNPVVTGVAKGADLSFNDLLLTSFYYVIAVVPDDEITVFLQYEIGIEAEEHTEQQIRWTEKTLFIDAYNSIVEFSFDSVYPETQTPAFLIHDVGYGIMDRILEPKGVFYSERTGNLKTIRTYEGVGADSNYMLTKFLQLRGFSLEDKKPFISFETWWKGVNPLFNLGLGFTNKQIGETFQTVIEVEEKKKFFDDSSFSLVLLNVRDITKSYDKDLYFNEVGFGIDKGEPEDVQGVDDPKKHYWTSVLRGIGKKFEQFTEFIFQSMTIESARRKRATKSTDYKYDDEVAIISVVEGGTDDEGFIHEPWPPLSVWGSVDTDPTVGNRWFYYVDHPYYTFSANHANGFGDTYFSTVRVNYKGGRTYHYKMKVEFIIASGTALVGFQLFLGLVQDPGHPGSLVASKTSIPTAVNADTPLQVEIDWEFVPPDDLRKYVAMRPTVLNHVGGVITMTILTKEDLTINIPAGGGGEYVPRIDEGFSSIIGLENEDTRYNKIITPARIFLRWLNFIASCLQDYSTSLFRSGSGEGNYTMKSTMDDNGQPESFGGAELAENQNFTVGVDYLFQPIPYTIKNHPITFDQWEYLLAHKKLAILVSQTDGDAVAFFAWSIQAKLFDGNMDLIVYPKLGFEIVKVPNPLPPSTYIFSDDFVRGPGGFNQKVNE